MSEGSTAELEVHRRWGPWIVGVSCALIVASALGTTIVADNQAETAALSFLTAVSAGDTRGAREQLTASAQLALTPPAFATLTSAPILAGWDDVEHGHVETWGGPPIRHACVGMVLEGAGGRWPVELSLERAGVGFRVDGMAVAPPDAAPRQHLLDACGPRSRNQR